ncbi:hypothetical protein NC797_05650 [Aquibacillus sp. 3ASR75-11]|uniref:Sporulation membrane protein YtrI C-terminal domain-containing protein n=1 Tax=Terrihalobacillus insolitus TaxID=2950438 RepID=A0A9X3WU56_9BACI|nr:sporulation membrane protein YtrI [Terrihalobacillus insolitus]MDC3412641.1 hypothetical protein [Terrihalobacillus insolitus]MDC3423991.1 hypothetical protein [Terrihalobacillus insolitus]
MDDTGEYRLMHIPPLFKKASWQRFLAGMFIGAIVAFLVFVYMYGSLYEMWVEERVKLESKIDDLEILVEDTKEKDKETKSQLQIKEIDILIEDDKRLKLDDLIKYQLREMVKGELKDVVGKNTSTVAENYQLLISTIENKRYAIDDFSYKLEVKMLAIAPKLRVIVSVGLSS